LGECATDESRRRPRPDSKINLIQIQNWSFGMWETSPPAAPLLLKERFDKTLVPLLEKERLGKVLPDHTKLQFST